MKSTKAIEKALRTTANALHVGNFKTARKALVFAASELGSPGIVSDLSDEYLSQAMIICRAPVERIQRRNQEERALFARNAA